MEAKKYEIKKFPLDLDLETPKVLKQLAKSYRRLSELKGIASTIPNEEILINSLSLQEARDLLRTLSRLRMRYLLQV